MNSSSKIPNDRLREILGERFDNFEPEVPDFFDAVAARTGAPNRRSPIRLAILTLLLTTMWSPLNVGLPVLRPMELTQIPEMQVDRPLGPAVDAAAAAMAGVTQRAPHANRKTVDAPVTSGDSQWPMPALSIVAMPRLEGPTFRRIAWKPSLPGVTTTQSDKAKSAKSKPGLSWTGGVGLNYTQYLLTVLPQENGSLNELTIPGFDNAVNWKPAVFAGVDYRNWQIRLSYQEFSQQLDYTVSSGEAEIKFSDNRSYTVHTLSQAESQRNTYRFAGVSLRKQIPLPRANGSYIGIGAGYQVELSRQHHGIWSQAFAGKSLRIGPAISAFAEIQLGYSFQPFVQAEPALSFKPYQTGLSTGIRWNPTSQKSDR